MPVNGHYFMNDQEANTFRPNIVHQALFYVPDDDPKQAVICLIQPRCPTCQGSGKTCTQARPCYGCIWSGLFRHYGVDCPYVHTVSCADCRGNGTVPGLAPRWELSVGDTAYPCSHCDGDTTPLHTLKLLEEAVGCDTELHHPLPGLVTSFLLCDACDGTGRYGVEAPCLAPTGYQYTHIPALDEGVDQD